MASAPSPALRAAARNPLGTHLLVSRGLVAGALADARRLGCEALQIFVGNPRGWARSPGDPGQDAEFRRRTAQLGVRVFLHAPYLVNLGSPTRAIYDHSVAAVAHQLARAAALGAEGVVVHTGSFVATGPDEARRHAAALAQVRDALLPILDAIADDAAPWLLLEPTAGQGRSLCAGVADLAPYLAALDHHPKAGICLDTCHVFAAGAPLDEPGGMTATLEELVAVAGPGRLRLVHVNDSRDPRGSGRDRHARLGEGAIGLGAFAELVAHPATDGVPLILETPGSREADNPDLALLRSMRLAVTRAPA